MKEKHLKYLNKVDNKCKPNENALVYPILHNILTTKKRNEEYHLKKESIKTIINNNANSKKNVDNEIINNNYQTKALEEKTEKEKVKF